MKRRATGHKTNKKTSLPPLIVILGPTACGKTAMAVKLARMFGGEIISADSRQVYRGLDIGSGKDLREYSAGGNPVPFHLIDVASPRRYFSLARYQKMAYRAIDSTLSRKAIPFLVGGTGLYIQAVVEGMVLPDAAPDRKRRRQLEKYNNEELLALLQKKDPEKAAKIDNHNTRRLIRAIEIAESAVGPSGFEAPPENKKNAAKASIPRYNPLILGLTYPIEDIRIRIKRRLEDRLQEGLIEEVARLRQNGMSWHRLDSLGLEYRYVALYLQNKLTRDEMLTQLATAIGQFAKRQMTWFKRDPRILWIRNIAEAKRNISAFLFDF